MLDFIDFPRGPLWHGDANNTHKTHTAMILAVSPRTISGFLTLNVGSIPAGDTVVQNSISKMITVRMSKRRRR